jgi:pilus assembly protein FimV
MKHKTLALAVVSGLSMMSVGADAASLGRITVFSALGQPLRAEIQISATREELIGMKASLAAEEAYAQANVDRYPALFNRLQLSIEKRPGGQNVIKVTSGKPINDPFLDFLVELNWPAGRSVREYTFLLDPPELQEQAVRQAVIESPRVARESGTSAPPIGGGDIPFPSNFTGEHLVKRGETLRGIAAANKPANVSLEQMLVAIYRSNTEAFIGNNVNRLRSGAVLLIPSEADAAVVPEKEARRVLYAHTAEWNKYRNKLADNASGGAVSDSGGTKTRPVSTVKDSSPKATERDIVTVSPATQLALNNQIKDQQSRIAELERLVREQKDLTEKQQKTMRLLKEELEIEKKKNSSVAPSVTQPPIPSVPAPTPPVEPAQPTEPPVEQSPPEPEPSPPEPEPLPPEPEVEPQAPVAPEPPPKTEEAPKAAPPVQAVEEIPEENPALLYLVFGVLSVVAAAGLFLLLRNSNRKARERTLAAASTADVSRTSLPPSDISRIGDLNTETAIQTSIAQNVDTSTPSVDEISVTGSSIFSRVAPGAIDMGEVDPVNEADLYLEYEKDEQAEEILLDALQKDPDRLAISVKLLEVYARRKSTKQFETLAQELRSRTGGIGEDWAKVIALGQALDPQNPLYKSESESDKITDKLVESGWDGVFAPELPEEPEPEEMQSKESNSLDFTTQTVPVFSPPAEDTDDALGTQTDPVNHTMDFTSDFSFKPEEKPTPVVDFSTGGDDDGALTKTDFDLESFAKRSTAREEFSPPRTEEAELPDVSLYTERPVESVKDSVETLQQLTVPPFETVPPATDFHDEKLGLSDIRGLAPEEEAVEEDVQFEADLTTSTILGSSGRLEPSEMEFDASLTESTILADPLAGIDLNLANAPEAPAPILSEPINVPAPPSSAATAEIDDTLRDEVNTKLELAQAYEDMGDVEGARELLNEVLGEGAPDQKAQAQEILDRLG